MPDKSVRRILHNYRNLHPYQLRTVHSLSDRDEEIRLQFCRHFQGILTDNPDLRNNRLMRDEADFHFRGTISDTGQLQILTNLTSVPFMTQKSQFFVLFGPEESLDRTSLRMKTDRPSHSRRNVSRHDQ